MLLPRFAACLLFASATLAPGAEAAPGQAAAAGPGQTYPSKPIRMVTGAPGAVNDLAARLIAQGLTVSLGRQVIVDNRASGVILGEIASKAPPDGYTLVLSGSFLWLASFLQDHVPWDPMLDFSPVTLVGSSPNVVVAHPSLAAASVTELIALAKARPGLLNYGSGSTGSSTHLAAELFKAMAGVDIVRIAYKGAAPAINDLIGGRVQLMFATVGSVAPHIKSDKLRALAVTSAEPSALLSGLPTVAASGLPGYEATSMYGVFAPAKTPAAIIDRLHREIVRFLNEPVVKEKLLGSGLEIVGSSPQQLAVHMKSEMARMGKMIKDAGIREQ